MAMSKTEQDEFDEQAEALDAANVAMGQAAEAYDQLGFRLEAARQRIVDLEMQLIDVGGALLRLQPKQDEQQV